MANHHPKARRDVAGLIEGLGGSSALARTLTASLKRRVPTSTVSEMKATGVILVRYWPALIAAAKPVPGLAWVDADALMRLQNGLPRKNGGKS